jgi:MoxR-like ATPase
MEFKRVQKWATDIIEQVAKAIVGKEEVLRFVMAGILAGGHILFEDYPGLAKTLIARCFAQVLALNFRRIQFTPDLLPADVTGSHIFNREKDTFELVLGPVFANILLADEINRATPKTQSALLEGMQEFQVTIDGQTRPLPSPFIVIATQNPIEYEGTFPLPEAQLDRFMMRLAIGYPNHKDEIEILRRRQERKSDEIKLEPMIDCEGLLAMRAAVEEIFVDPDLESYIVSITSKTRDDSNVYVGASPRGSLALLKLARAQAALEGRNYVLPDDVKHFAIPALAHRLILRPELWSKRITPQDVVTRVLDQVPVPKVD